MKSRFTDRLAQVVLISIVAFAVSVGCSASRSAGSPAQVTDSPTSNQSSSPIVSSSAQEKAACPLNISQAPVLNGLRLGMTPEEVLALFPGSKEDAELRRRLSEPPSQFGVSSLMIRPSKYESRDKFAEVSQISFHLLDGRVSNFTVSYNGPEWPHVDNFVAKFVEGTSLPPVGQWQAHAGMSNQSKNLICSDFEVRIFAGGQGGNLNYVLMQDLEADKKLKDRRRKAREQASPTPGNQ
jgi:hypothetical protein